MKARTYWSYRKPKIAILPKGVTGYRDTWSPTGHIANLPVEQYLSLVRGLEKCS